MHLSHHWQISTTIALVAAVIVISLFLPPTTARVMFLVPLASFAVVTAVISFVLRFAQVQASHV